MEFKFRRVCTEHYLPVCCSFDVWRRYLLRTWLHFIVLYQRRMKGHAIYWIFDILITRLSRLRCSSYSFEYYSTIEFFRSSRFWQRRDVIYVRDIWFTLKILCYSDTIEDWQSFCQEASLTLCSQSTRRDSAATSTTDRPHDGQRLR